MTHSGPLVTLMQAAAEVDPEMGAWIARHGLPRLVRRGDDGEMVYADTGERVPCACGRAVRCAQCTREIARRRMQAPQAWQQGRLAL